MPRAEPAVRAALEAAAAECITDYWCAQDWQQAEARREAAAAIVAFLRVMGGVVDGKGWVAGPNLAAAVASAAAEGE